MKRRINVIDPGNWTSVSDAQLGCVRREERSESSEGMDSLPPFLFVAGPPPTAGHGNTRRMLRWLIAMVLAFAAPLASASFHSFQIDQIYSNADGTVQFVVLREAAGFGSQNFLAGHVLTSTHGGANKTFQFTTDLPSSATAGKHVLIATQGFAALGIVAPDYVIPNSFLATDGGTVNYAGVDQVSYASLPTDSVHAIDRNGSAVTNVATNFSGVSTSVTVTAAMVDLNQHGLTGSWYEPATGGQGFEVEVYPDRSPGMGLAQVSWFTYDNVVGGAERQRWYTLSGPVVSEQPSASLTIYQNTGGNFNAPPLTTAQPVGTATLSFDTCTSGQLSYTLTDGTGRAGSIPLTRLTQNVTCSTTAARPTDADFALSGNWYAPATSGQGLTVEVNPNSGTVFSAWYTYAPNSASAGATGQRWYTAQPTAAFTPGSRSLPVQIFETTGGMFDAPMPPGQKTVQVGSGTLAFQSCSAATFSYNLTGGSSSGLSGTITLSRVGPVPPGCTQ
jgi:hypothetical protein